MQAFLSTIEATNVKECLGSLAILLTFIAFIPYIRSILQGRTKPHVFSWVIWSVATPILFVAQLADKGGAGAWSTGVSGVITLYIAILAYVRKTEIVIKKIDWLFFILALSAIPFWYVTSNPLWAVILLTSIDTVGFFPTIRKAYFKPFEEPMLMYMIVVVRGCISIMALEHYSLTTLLFPVTITLVSVALIGLVIWRRRSSPHDEACGLYSSFIE
ncbi:MAG: hypothetical protein IPP74_08335 [Alphaproteobacteria bacterium]|nr:hypothetical protein [Alphaproteobacteria bacterium]